jgi:hypothetical protein
MNGKQLGRNMLIQRYLWVSYCQTLPPGVKGDESMRRGRKQVSSHIQVLKNFFTHHRCCASPAMPGLTLEQIVIMLTVLMPRSLLLPIKGKERRRRHEAARG